MGSPWTPSMAMTVASTAAGFGAALSLYALYVETSAAADPSYKALCDIEAIGASCTAVFTSDYGRMLSHLGLVAHDGVLDLPNAATGLVYYVLVMLMPFMPLARPVQQWALLLATAGACAASAYLAWALTQLGDFCVVCVSTYIVNGVILVAALSGVAGAGNSAARSTKPKSG